MKRAIAVIEQETKYINDSEEGSKEYRKGYIRAFEIIAEFLGVYESGRAFYLTSCPAVQRLLSCSLPIEESLLCGRHREFHLTETLTALERDALEIALGVLRSDTDYGDFLNSWLWSYGAKVLSPDPPSPLVPHAEAELELLDAER